MSRPSFENIDQWLFEYTEGTLSSAQESQLMDFIRMHPELVSELKTWNLAKVTPKATPSFSTAALLKPTPVLLRPISMITIGFTAILLGWVGFYFYPKNAQYSKSNIDAEIIYALDEDLYDDSFLFSSKLEKTSSGNEKGVRIDNRTENSIDNNTTKQSANSKTFIQRADTSPNLFNQKQSASTTNNNESDINIALSNEDIEDFSTSEKTEIDYTELHNVQQNFETKANDLDAISAYLNGTNEKDLTHTSSKIISSAEVSKSSFKKSISNTYRKIKRMADQPIALRNTKNPHYHAPMMTGYKANSAMVGSAPGNRIQATSRIQWLNKENTQLLNTLSWDGYVYALRGGLGVDVNYNGYKVDALNTYSAGLTYSPKFSINKAVSFEPAIRFKMGVVNIDPTSELIGNKIELNRHNIISLFENESQVNGSQLWYKDISLGFMLNTKWFYAGFNADNLGRHNNNFYSADLSKKYREKIHYTAVIGTEYQPIMRDIKVSGYGLFQKYGSLNEFWLGGNFQYSWLQVGIGVSSKTDLGASLGVDLHRFSFHYNIDYTKSILLDSKFLSHQVTMKILLKPNRYAAKFLNL